MSAMRTIYHQWLNLQLVFQVVRIQILATSYLYVACVLFVLILFSLQWLFNIDQLVEIVFGGSPLSLLDRIDFLLNGFINIFRFANDFIPITMIVIALLQSLGVTLVIMHRRTFRMIGRGQIASLGLGLAGFGCVACGGSILTPLLSVVAISVSVALAQAISHLLLLLSLVLSYIALVRLALIVASRTQK